MINKLEVFLCIYELCTNVILFLASNCQEIFGFIVTNNARFNVYLHSKMINKWIKFHSDQRNNAQEKKIG